MSSFLLTKEQADAFRGTVESLSGDIGVCCFEPNCESSPGSSCADQMGGFASPHPCFCPFASCGMTRECCKALTGDESNYHGGLDCFESNPCGMECCWQVDCPYAITPHLLDQGCCSARGYRQVKQFDRSRQFGGNTCENFNPLDQEETAPLRACCRFNLPPECGFSDCLLQEADCCEQLGGVPFADQTACFDPITGQTVCDPIIEKAACCIRDPDVCATPPAECISYSFVRFEFAKCDCDERGGEFSVGKSCSDIREECHQPPLGACCIDEEKNCPDNAGHRCKVVTEECCEREGGEFFAGRGCFPNDLQGVSCDFRGACCFDECERRRCEENFFAVCCKQAGGEYQGDDTICANRPCDDPGCLFCCGFCNEHRETKETPADRCRSLLGFPLDDTCLRANVVEFERRCAKNFWHVAYKIPEHRENQNQACVLRDQASPGFDAAFELASIVPVHTVNPDVCPSDEMRPYAEKARLSYGLVGPLAPDTALCTGWVCSNPMSSANPVTGGFGESSCRSFFFSSISQCEAFKAPGFEDFQPEVTPNMVQFHCAYECACADNPCLEPAP